MIRRPPRSTQSRAWAASVVYKRQAKFRGAVYFQTSAPSLMAVNGKCMVYEWDVDGQGNATWDIWEWV